SRQREEQRARRHAPAVDRQPGNRPIERAFQRENLVLGQVVGKLRGHLENAVRVERGPARTTRGSGLGERVNERIVLIQITDHRRPPSLAAMRLGRAGGWLWDWMLRMGMSRSPMRLND